MSIKSYEDKINNYEKRINKLQKGERIEYKNSHEVNVGFQRTERIVLSKEEYTLRLAKEAVEAHNTLLMEENNELKNFLKEIFNRTQRIYQKIDH